MSLKVYKPITPSRRFMTGFDFSDITTNKPYKPLCEWLKTTGGRNHHGHVSFRHRGGGHRHRRRPVRHHRLAHSLRRQPLGAHGGGRGVLPGDDGALW